MFQITSNHLNIFRCWYDSDPTVSFYVDTNSFLSGQTEYICSNGKLHSLTSAETQLILQEYKRASEEKITNFEQKLKQELSLFGIVCNRQGKRESNHLLSGIELMKFDDTLYHKVITSPDKMAEGGSNTFTTWTCYALDSLEEIKSFLTGGYNCLNSEELFCARPNENNPFGIIDDLDSWHWETSTEDSIFGPADTTKRAINLLSLPKESLTGKEEAPEWAKCLSVVRERIQSAFSTYGKANWRLRLQSVDKIPTWHLVFDKPSEINQPTGSKEIALITEADADYFNINLEAIGNYYELPIEDTSRFFYTY